MTRGKKISSKRIPSGLRQITDVMPGRVLSRNKNDSISHPVSLHIETCLVNWMSQMLLRLSHLFSPTRGTNRPLMM